ncbi:MAG: hypothetical protein AAFN74_27380, partial [Myxococcota bacterium]
GYTAEQLAPFGVVDEELPPEPLQIADGCRTPLLPAPRTQLERINDEWTTVTNSAELRLTAPFVESVCADLEQVEDWYIDERCSGAPSCEARPSIIGRCAVSFDLEECGGGRIEISIGPNGEACTDIIDRPELCQPREDTDGLAGLACTDGCRIDIYRDARDIEPPFSVEYIDFASGPLRTPPFEVGSSYVRPWVLAWGYGQAMIDIGDQIVVASHHEQGQPCAGDDPRFVFIDPVTLGTSTSAAPGCMSSLVPFESGFFGTHLDFGGWRLSRFDQRGQVQASARLRFEGQNVDGEAVPMQLLMSRDGRRVIVVIDRIDGNAALILLTAADLSTQSALRLDNVEASYHATQTDDRLLLVTGSTGEILLIDVEQGADTSALIASFTSLVLYRPLYIGGGRTLIGSGFEAGVYVIDEQGTDFGVNHPGRSVDQSVFALSPFDEDAYLAVGAEPDFGGRKVVATLFDRNALRFRPGVWTIGQGIPSQIIQRAGRWFVLLPWIGQVAVLEPKQ